MYEVFQKYSSREVYQIAEKAKTKGLTLLEWDYYEGDLESYTGKGYCVMKEIAGQYLTLFNNNDGTFRQCYVGNSYYNCTDRTVSFDLTLEQAENFIINFDGIIENYPRFFAFVRVYKNEPESFGTVQQICLDEFAYRHGITYAGKFICFGGLKYEPCGAQNEAAVNDVIEYCKQSFTDITESDFLVVTDFSRLNNEIKLWEDKYAIISVRCEDAHYSHYNRQYKYYYYSESIQLRKEIRSNEKVEEEKEYREIRYEYQKMMSEMDIPDVPAIEWNEEDEEDEEPCIVPEEQDE